MFYWLNFSNFFSKLPEDINAFVFVLRSLLPLIFLQNFVVVVYS